MRRACVTAATLRLRAARYKGAFNPVYAAVIEHLDDRVRRVLRPVQK